MYDTWMLLLLLLSATVTSLVPEFHYRGGAKVSKKKICDSTANCHERSHELKDHCRGLQNCHTDTFQCENGALVDQKYTCDGTSHCTDNSDELCEYSKDRCRLPNLLPHTNYDVIGCQACSPGAFVNQSQVLEYSCHVGYKLTGSQIVECDGSVWLPQLPTCRKDTKALCPAIDNTRLSVTCIYKHRDTESVVPCDQPLLAGTVASYKCHTYYEPIKQDKTNTNSECKGDGTWSRKILECKPECGRRGMEINPLVVHGTASHYGEWPWVATMYLLQDGNYTYRCGGSLISENAVITAAHCVWKLSVNTVRIALGKFEREYGILQEHTQMKDVVNIVMEPDYQDQTGNYGSDVAVVILATPVVFTDFVRPVCIDWSGTGIGFTDNTLGVVAGWGINENETFSDRLQEAHLPVIATEKCRELLPNDFKKFVTYTSFCAGWKNGTSVCNGDSGSGLVFPGSGSLTDGYTIQGIVSVSPRQRGTSFCDPNFYTIFTKVSIYTKWLETVLAPFETPPK